jgi:hypothetical protein
MKRTNQSNGGGILEQTAPPLQQSVIKSEHSFKPQIHKKSQQLKRDKPIEEHLYEDFKERQIKKIAAVHGQQAQIQEKVTVT